MALCAFGSHTNSHSTQDVASVSLQQQNISVVFFFLSLGPYLQACPNPMILMYLHMSCAQNFQTSGLGVQKDEAQVISYTCLVHVCCLVILILIQLQYFHFTCSYICSAWSVNNLIPKTLSYVVQKYRNLQ